VIVGENWTSANYDELTLLLQHLPCGNQYLMNAYNDSTTYSSGGLQTIPFLPFSCRRSVSNPMRFLPRQSLL
jgi:hypothetical protein